MKRTCMFILLFVSLCLSVSANEVALVTELSGKVAAEFQGDKWTIELAEMIPAESTLKTGDKGHLTIVHFPLNKEFQIGENAEIMVGEKSVKSEQAIETTSLKMVAENVSLNADMNQQTGAADADKALSKNSVNPGSVVPEELLEVGEDSFTEEEQSEVGTNNKKLEVGLDHISEVSPSKSDDYQRKLVDSHSNSQNCFSRSPSAKTKEEKESTRQRAMPKKLKKPEINKNIAMAMPKEIYEKFSLEEGQPIILSEFPSAEISKVNLNDGWYILSLSLPETFFKMNKKLSLKALEGSLEFQVNTFNSKIPAVKDLWMLEQSGFYAQAACGWIQLHNEGAVKDRLFKSHMKRLKSKM